MNINVQFIGGLEIPAGVAVDRDGTVYCAVADGASLSDVLEQLNLPDNVMAMVNSVPVQRTDRATHSLADGDEVIVFPALKGG